MEQNSTERSGFFGQIDLYSILRDIIRNLWVILLVAIAAGMLMNVYARMNHQTSYSAEAMFAVKSRSSTTSRTNLTAASSMASSFENILNSSLLKKKVCEDLNVKTFDARASAQVISRTNLIKIGVTADSPYKAFRFISSTMRVIDELVPYVSDSMVLEVLQEPSVPRGADATFTGIPQAVKGFLAAGALMTMLFAVLSYFKNTVRSESELEEKVGGRILGVLRHQRARGTLIERIRGRSDSLLITDVNARFDYVEKMKKIASTLSNHMKRSDQKVLLVTSVNPHEGKSTVSANIALALAQQDRRVLLIDGDLRSPALYNLFLPKKTKLEYTLNALLAGKCTVKEAIMREGSRNLFLLLNDKGNPHSTDIVASRRMNELIDAAKPYFDFILIDSPPFALMSDAEAFAEWANVTVLTVKYDYSTVDEINDAVETLGGCKAEFYGCVLNDVHTLLGDRSVGGYGGYGSYGKYGYGYGRYGKYGKYGKYGAYGRYGAYGHTSKASSSGKDEKQSLT